MDRSGTLLYDGDCGVCVVTAQWLADRVPAARLGLLALQNIDMDSALARAVTGRNLAATIHFVRADGEVMTGARAVLAAGRLVPRWRSLAIAADHPLGHITLEPLYRQVASHRRRIGRLMGLPDSCPLINRAREVS